MNNLIWVADTIKKPHIRIANAMQLRNALQLFINLSRINGYAIIKLPAEQLEKTRIAVHQLFIKPAK